jgi:ribokinase
MDLSQSPSICVIGSSNVDLIFHTPRMPRSGETLHGRGFRRVFGGKGANQAVTAARLGARVCFVARLGDDPFGHESLQNLRGENLDTTHVKFDAERATGVAGIIVDDAAENCIIVTPGANAGLSPDDIREAASAIESADSLLCQLETPVDATLEAFRIARHAKVRTILTPAPAVSLPDELLRLTDLLVPNETELALLTGGDDHNFDAVEAAANLLRQRGARAVIVTLGERGALLIDGEGSTAIQPVTVKAVDTTGAGDAFTGGLAVFLAEGLALRDAARQASRVAALTVTRFGTQPAFPSRAEFEAGV